MTKAIIKLQNVWKIYGSGESKVNALKSINLKIKKGEFLAIVGPSGSGKSTMVNLMGCLDLPSKGKIFLDGNNIAKLSESKLAQARGQKIGFVFQQFNLIPTLTALKNVMLPMEFQDVDASSAKKKAMELLNSVGLGKRVNHLPSQLSGGEAQRVALARALVVSPEIVLADEPTGNLDSKTGQFIMNLLEGIHKKDGKTIVLITHDIYLVEHAERIVHLKDGQIVHMVKLIHRKDGRVDRINYNYKKEGVAV